MQLGKQLTQVRKEVLFATHKPVDELTTEDIMQGIELRMERREILTRESPVEFRVVLDEAALRRVVGSREVMREQYEELIKLHSLDLAPADAWFKSSYSGGNGNSCVEVAHLAPHHAVATRDSKQDNGPAFLTSHHAWSAFVTGVSTGAFTV
ncbi:MULTISPECIES: DUF397 domain-containing protein [unclassified Streptomyces]|uniref:DUF397 domain-containing protein n=1 Tax=unclassified Streptomyces TaxID=2593676 RepID=UPI001CB6F438|nr:MULTISPECIES: DUF397 domain-containing protein [unclassified Streptomyces]MBD0710668.1 hypothetical protein [Streptomyces sp. CBMA291]MBD0715515.1 hypothetical protein [Streptomyces sp. CBMA370]